MIIHKRGNAFDHVEIMLDQYYGNNHAFDKVVFFLGYNVFYYEELKSLVEEAKANGCRTIAYQLEQCYPGSTWVNGHTIRNLRMFDEVWDYDMKNIDFLSTHCNITPKLRPMLYTDALNKIPRLSVAEHDIDMLFYGSMNESRSAILTEIQRHCRDQKYKVTYLSDAWGAELDAYIARSKIVLNLHYFPEIRQEQVRMFYLTSNGKCVLSEYSEHNYMKDSILNVQRMHLPNVCMELLSTGAWKRVADAATDKYKAISKDYVSRFR